jgi:hypothetical protein
MSLPPKNDPQRPLAFAVRVARLLGLLLIVLGALWLVPIMFFDVAKHPTLAIFQVRGAMLALIPGGAYLTLSLALQRRRLWAAVMTIVIAGIHAALSLWIAVALGTSLARDEVSSEWFIVFGAVLLLTAALGQLIFFVARALRTIRNPPVEQARGFDPLPPS